MKRAAKSGFHLADGFYERFLPSTARVASVFFSVVSELRGLIGVFTPF
jgi:hypothetical protein